LVVVPYGCTQEEEAAALSIDDLDI
jgi:hypothetical protein